ncbi:gap junction protein alpha 10 a [Engraulis encrasicolus]|uniref:gap junction protein alpha 10 a n=1 Tax=Engraulis encrasicolus TaxID=184585 RepID=UPI002FCF1253
MGDWNLLGSILEEVHIHSTIVGKIWLTILFIFRMLVLGVAAEDVWVDEQSQFVCNTEQPGCKNVCYNSAFPISLIRFWVLQIVFVSSPSLVYMGHALYRLRTLDKERHRRRVQLRAELEGGGGEGDPLLEGEAGGGGGIEHRHRLERELRRLEETKRVKKAPLRGSLLRTYVIHILTRSVVEVGFIVAQYILYGLGLDPLYQCNSSPCPNIVDCYVSRPTEKTIFMVFMIVIACVSLFLNLLEISHLGVRQIKQSLAGLRPIHDCDSLGNLVHKIPNLPSQHQLCLVANMSPQKKNSGALLPTSFGTPEGLTDPNLYLTSAMDLIPPTRQLRLSSQGRIQGLRFQMPPERGISESQPQLPALMHHPQPLHPQFPSTSVPDPLGGGGEPHRRLSVLTQPSHELQLQHLQQHHPGGPLQPNHMTAPRLSMPALPSHLAQHRPSLAESRRLFLQQHQQHQQDYSSDSDVPYPARAGQRKASFMARLPASDSATTSNVSSCPSSQQHSSEESELGSLTNVAGSGNPMLGGGRRMSMASKANRLMESDLLI